MKIVIFGVGENIKHIIFNIRNNKTRFIEQDIAYIVDNHKYGSQYEYIDGKKYDVYFPIKLLEDKEEKMIIISSINNYYPIATQLTEFGFKEGKDFVGWGGLLQADWVTMEKLIPAMEYRVKFMGDFITDDVLSVADLGCGNMDLKKYINKNVKYIPVDYFPHDETTIICDLDSGIYPNIKVDAIVMGAILEHIRNFESLVKWVCNSVDKEIILSYTPIEYLSDINIRMKHGCKNHMSVDELIQLFETNNMKLEDSKIMQTIKRPLYKFRKRGTDDEYSL